MIYFDNAATGKPKNSVSSQICAYISTKDRWGNPSSTYDFVDGDITIKKILSDKRKIVADAIGCKPEEIIFTSGGSESDNMAIKGVVFASDRPKKHIITSKIEHKAVLKSCEFLEKYGLAEVTYLNVNSLGIIDLDELKNAIREDTVLVSIMTINNEVGSVQPIKEISEILKPYNIPFHTDAVQAAGRMRLYVDELGVDLMSISGHKIGTPKGIGILYKREGIQIEPLIHGGSQEFGLRAGTENIPYICGISAAMENINNEENFQRIKELSYKFIHDMDTLCGLGKGVRVIGRPTNETGIIAVAFKGIKADVLREIMAENGIYVSVGSACNAGQTELSHVMKAIDTDEDWAENFIRVSLSADNSESEIQRFWEIAFFVLQCHGDAKNVKKSIQKNDRLKEIQEQKKMQ